MERKIDKLFKETRHLMQLTQKEFGSLLGISQSHVAKIEKKEKMPSMNIYLKVIDLNKRVLAE